MDQTDLKTYALQRVLNFMLVFNCLVPFWIIVCQEIVNLLLTLFIQWDADFIDEQTGRGIQCLNLAMHQDIGVVKHIFADKTGTLTKNEMKFKGAYVIG